MANDGQVTHTNNMTVTIVAINQPPTYTLSTNSVLVGENAGVVTLTNFLSGFSPGPTNEAGQTSGP